jgi:protein-tyrosine phosphatase
MTSQYTESWLYQIHEKYGGKRAWLRTHVYRWMDGLRLLPAGSAKSRLSEFRRLVFACQGNICRSPYGEARARQLGISSASFGLGADDGKEAHFSATKVARQRGLTLEFHRATHLSKFPFQPGDLILAFEPQQLEQLISPGVLPEFVTADLLGRWCSPAFPYLHDPYGLDDAYFDICFNRIDQALARLAPLVPSSFMHCDEAPHHPGR